jgi:vacuolar-type H+-ATPase subunit H
MVEDFEFKGLLEKARRSNDYCSIEALFEHVIKDPEKYAGPFLVFAAELAKKKISSANEEEAENISTAFRKMYNVYKEYASETDLKKIHEILQ